jgi:SAM-dependent methyltransferase
MIGLDQTVQDTLYNSGKYAEISPDWSDGESQYKAAGLTVLLKKNGYLNVEKILDIGCGSGGVLAHLVSGLPSVKRCLGIDTAPDAIKIGMELRKQNDRVALECRALDSISEKFDLVIASHVVEHVENYGSFLYEMSEKADILYINIPCEINVFYSLRSSSHVETFQKYGHINFFSEKFFDRFVEAHGFEIVDRGYGDEFKAQDRRSVLGFLAYLARIGLGVLSKSFAMQILGGWSYQILLIKRSQS